MDQNEDQNPKPDPVDTEVPDAPPELAGARGEEAAAADAADATEAEVSEVVQDENQEKQPMTAGGDQPGFALSEKNGCVKVKLEDDEDEKFTGLNKEELMRVAGTPGWVRTRWALLVLFWLGWLGMLGGAALLIAQAPRCRELPVTHWWNKGALYRIPSVQAFTYSGDIAGVRQKVDALYQLKFKGLVLGPVHVAPPDDATALSFQEIAPEAGSLEQLKDLLVVAHRKGMSVVLDLTPNYLGSSRFWYSNASVTAVAEKLKSALVFWFSEGVDGVQLADVEYAAAVVPSLWEDIRAIVRNGTNEQPARRLLMGVSERRSAAGVSAVLASTGVDLLTSEVLLDDDMETLVQSVLELYSANGPIGLAWNLGGRSQGHMASLVKPDLVPLYQVLLFTLPGTPVLEYGDEIGLTDDDNKFPKMIWDDPAQKEEEKLNGTLKEAMARRASSRLLVRSLSDLRAKERSLLFGDFDVIANSSKSLVFVRSWDRNARFLAAFNWESEEAGPLGSRGLPPLAEVVVATGGTLKAGAHVEPAKLRLGAGEAVLLKFPYAG
ncbi:4F2 cell-surface antigen heavy chain-like [Corythoichthys intestinalis]|uniref:4F2 cell-surface antigen heavy chain-like n=1 Tax=Corythoichthys intestinalis TaxID=161448 RepID=UPI0025A4E5B4|nr:4F2 cell-surface antigen heavy chain-like [Corythoichthys intestinalis]XP_061798729.1 amino acid transporter heavy chain SLC3A2-like [Nerophis lumbriciformis]